MAWPSSSLKHSSRNRAQHKSLPTQSHLAAVINFMYEHTLSNKHQIIMHMFRECPQNDSLNTTTEVCNDIGSENSHIPGFKASTKTSSIAYSVF